MFIDILLVFLTGLVVGWGINKYINLNFFEDMIKENINLKRELRFKDKKIKSLYNKKDNFLKEKNINLKREIRFKDVKIKGLARSNDKFLNEINILKERELNREDNEELESLREQLSLKKEELLNNILIKIDINGDITYIKKEDL